MKQRKIKETESKITDIFNGEYITIWRDEEIIFFCTPFVTINFTEEEWNIFKKDIEKLVDL